MEVLMEVPYLGIGQVVTVTDDPARQPEKDEVVWLESEINELLRWVGDNREIRRMWVSYLDAVKRMYPGAKLVSLQPLVVEHTQLTPEMLRNIPWQELPRK
jgi:hypothetical protein